MVFFLVSLLLLFIMAFQFFRWLWISSHFLNVMVFILVPIFQKLHAVVRRCDELIYIFIFLHIFICHWILTAAYFSISMHFTRTLPIPNPYVMHIFVYLHIINLKPIYVRTYRWCHRNECVFQLLLFGEQRE